MRPIFLFFFSLVLFLLCLCGSRKLWEDTERVKKRKSADVFAQDPCDFLRSSVLLPGFCFASTASWSVRSVKLPVEVSFLALVSTLCVGQMVSISDSHEDVVFTGR